jgi:hypothetical protein
VKSLDDSCWAKVVIQRMQTCKNARKNVLVFLLYKELKNMYSIKICQTEKKRWMRCKICFIIYTNRGCSGASLKEDV